MFLESAVLGSWVPIALIVVLFDLNFHLVLQRNSKSMQAKVFYFKKLISMIQLSLWIFSAYLVDL